MLAELAEDQSMNLLRKTHAKRRLSIGQVQLKKLALRLVINLCWEVGQNLTSTCCDYTACVSVSVPVLVEVSSSLVSVLVRISLLSSSYGGQIGQWLISCSM